MIGLYKLAAGSSTPPQGSQLDLLSKDSLGTDLSRVRGTEESSVHGRKGQVVFTSYGEAEKARIGMHKIQK